MTEVISTAKLW